MKILKFIFFFTFTINAIGQSSLSNDILNHWKNTEITLKDGSRVFDPNLKSASFDIKFLSKDSLMLFNNGRASNFSYIIKDSLLIFNEITFNIKMPSSTNLVLDQTVEVYGIQTLSFKFIPKKLFDLTYTPLSYYSKNGDIVYQTSYGKLEPYFIDKNKSAMDFIFEEFGFPDNKNGGFVARFIVTKNGELKGVKVVATSNERYNNKLVSAILKTKDKWLSAEYLGDKVNIEVEYDFNLGYEDRTKTSSLDSIEYSKMYSGYGIASYAKGSYQEAESYYKKAINYNPLNIFAYYQHAVACIQLGRREEACIDYNQLIFLDQEKAKTLSDKFCK